MNDGKGLIRIEWKGDTITYVYSPYLMVTWVEKTAEHGAADRFSDTAAI